MRRKVRHRTSTGLLGACHGIPGSAEGEVGGHPEHTRVRGVDHGPVAVAENAAAAAGYRPVGGELDPDEEVAGAADVEAEALATRPEDLRGGPRHRLDQRLGVAYGIDPPVP